MVQTAPRRNHKCPDMKTKIINKWLTLGASIGILIGLVLVLVEIRQNSDLLRLQFINDDLIAVAQTEDPLLGENPADVLMKAMYRPEDMTYADFRVADAYLVAKIELIHRRYRLGQEGILEEGAWKKDLGFSFEWLFGNKFGRLWWEHEGRRVYSDYPEIVDFVDSAINGMPEDISTRSWEKIQDELTSESTE